MKKTKLAVLAATTAAALPAVSFAATAHVDAGEITGMIESYIPTIVTIGTAVLGVTLAIAAFAWIRRGMGNK